MIVRSDAEVALDRALRELDAAEHRLKTAQSDRIALAKLNVLAAEDAVLLAKRNLGSARLTR